MELWLAIPALHVQKSALLSSATSDHCWRCQETFPLSSWFQAAASRIPQLHGPWLRLWPSPDWAAWTSTDKQIMQSVLWASMWCMCLLLCLCVVMSLKHWTMPQETLIWQGAYHQFLILLTLSSTPSSPNRRRPRYLSLLKTLKVAAMIGCATTGGK